MSIQLLGETRELQEDQFASRRDTVNARLFWLPRMHQDARKCERLMQPSPPTESRHQLVDAG